MTTVVPQRLAAWNRLVTELKADRIDSPVARDSIRDLGVLGLLVRAWARAKRRELAAARDDLETALRAAGDAPVVLLVAGMLGALVREPGVALARLQAAERDPRLAPRALAFELKLTRRLCWSRLAREVAERALTSAPALQQRAHGELSQLLEQANLLEGALREAEAALPSSPSTDQCLDHARRAACSGRADIAERMVGAALDQSGASDAVLVAGAEILMAAGAFGHAEMLLRQIVERDGANAQALSRLAELRLWHADDAAAAALAARALEADPASAAALRTRGICAFNQERLDEAHEWFDRAVATCPQGPETRVWRARTRLRLDPALDQHLKYALEHTDPDLEEASKLRGGFCLAAELVRFQHEAARMLHNQQTDRSGRTGLVRQFVEPVLPFLRLMQADAGAILASQQGEAQHALLSRGVAALGANYSTLTTLCRDGRLEPVRVTFIREEARQALETIRVLPPAEVRVRLEQVIERYPESSLPLCYMGELYVWLGEVDEARQWLHRAIEHTPTSRWAYIGLGACELIEGHWAEALDVLVLGVERMSNTTGPAVYPPRAEALRQLGRFDEARAGLQRAVETVPERLATWINVGLLEAAVGDEPALSGAFERVRRQAAGLVADAAEEAHEVAWLDADGLPSASVQQRLLEHMLRMLRGNRATSLTTYFRRDGSFRVLIPENNDPARFDAEDLRASWSLIELLSPARRPRR